MRLEHVEIPENCFIVGDLTNINQKNKRDISFEEVSYLLIEYSYIEVDFSTGFNVDKLQNMIIENFHKVAKSRIDELN